MFRNTCLAIGVIAALIASGVSTDAAELVMYESPACVWCERWNQEIAPAYPKTAESRMAPLRRVDIDDDRPADLKNIKGVIYTPTFVLVHLGQEVGRITGYPGEDFFWGLFEELVKKLPPEVAACGQTKGPLSGQPDRRTMVC